MSARVEIGLAKVTPLCKKPRKGMQELAVAADQLNEIGLARLAAKAEVLASHHPRFRVPISIDVRGKREDFREVMRIAELMDDGAICELKSRAMELVAENALHPITAAQVLKFPTRTARKGQKQKR